MSVLAPSRTLTTSSSTVLTPSRVAPWLVAAAAAVIAIASARVDAQLAVYWALGLGLGLVLQRGRFCFAGAFRDLFLMRNGTMMRAILVGLAIVTPVFALIESKAVPDPSFGAVANGAHVVPLGLNLLAGGVLFGIGMVVAGGCVSGTLYRIAEGYVASWASLLGILVGLSLAAHTWNFWYAWTIQVAPTVWLPTSLGYGGAVVVSLALLAAAYVASVWWETREASGPAVPIARPKRSPTPTTLVAHLDAVRLAIFGRGWSPLTAATALAVLNVAAFLISSPIGVTGELSAWADRGAGLIGLAAPPLLGADALAGCNLAFGQQGVVTGSTLLDAGLVVGALLAALAAREFKIRLPRQRRRYVQSLGGGTLMGYGAGIGVGCTLGAFFSAIPSLGLNGWVFGLALLVGAGLGTQIIRRIA
jgi:uncharacterized protein